MFFHQDYCQGLSTEDLVDTLRSLLAAERTAMRLTCRYLADLADRMKPADEDWLHEIEEADGPLAGFQDIYHAAECLFGLGAHSTRERIRVGRALRSLPQIEDALVSGELSYSRAREVTRVATPDDESSWLDLARALPIRTLERRVAEAKGKEPPAGTAQSEATGKEPPAGTAQAEATGKEPAPTEGPDTVEVTLRLPAEAWALLQRAMEGARRASEASLSDAEALAAVARDAIDQQSTGDDAEGEPVFHDATDALLSEPVGSPGGRATMPVGSHAAKAVAPVASQRGTPVAVPVTSHHGGGTAASHSGTPVAVPVTSRHGGTAASQRGTRAVTGVGEEAAALLALMGRRGGWSVDALVDASGLRVGAVCYALLELELAGRVACEGLGRYTPCASPVLHLH